MNSDPRYLIQNVTLDLKLLFMLSDYEQILYSSKIGMLNIVCCHYTFTIRIHRQLRITVK